jgi:hypothetical protein
MCDSSTRNTEFMITNMDFAMVFILKTFFYGVSYQLQIFDFHIYNLKHQLTTGKIVNITFFFSIFIKKENIVAKPNKNNFVKELTGKHC